MSRSPCIKVASEARRYTSCCSFLLSTFKLDMSSSLSLTLSSISFTDLLSFLDLVLSSSTSESSLLKASSMLASVL